jgi:hypothetical protein
MVLDMSPITNPNWHDQAVIRALTQRLAYRTRARFGVPLLEQDRQQSHRAPVHAQRSVAISYVIMIRTTTLR